MVGASRPLPAASAILTGTEVSLAELRQRFEGVRRIWLVTIRGLPWPPPDSRTDHEKMALTSQLHLLGRWHAGGLTLRLYARRTGQRPYMPRNQPENSI